MFPAGRLTVYYPPVSATQPAAAVSVEKGGRAVVQCGLADKGFPPATAAVWLRGGIRMKNESGLQVEIVRAGVESDRNYTCIPFNEAGKGMGSSVAVLVTTAPNLVKPLPARTGAPIHREKVSYIPELC